MRPKSKILCNDKKGVLIFFILTLILTIKVNFSIQSKGKSISGSGLSLVQFFEKPFGVDSKKESIPTLNPRHTTFVNPANGHKWTLFLMMESTVASISAV